MGGDGVSDVNAAASEGVGGMVNGTGLTSGSIARSGASEGGTSAANLKLHTNLPSNPNTPPVSTFVNPPHSTLAPAALMGGLPCELSEELVT